MYAIRIRTSPECGHYAEASTCDGIVVTAYDSIQADYVLDNVYLVQTWLSLSLSFSFPIPGGALLGIGNRIDLIKRMQQEASGACYGFITDYDAVLAKGFLA